MAKNYVAPEIEIEEQEVNHGNTKLPYGLAKEKGINTDGMTPRQVWEELKNRYGTKHLHDVIFYL